MATEGIVRRPTLALIGEAGPEAVVPLSEYTGSGGGEIHIHNNLTMPDGDVLLKNVVKAGKRNGLWR